MMFWFCSVLKFFNLNKCIFTKRMLLFIEEKHLIGM